MSAVKDNFYSEARWTLHASAVWGIVRPSVLRLLSAYPTSGDFDIR